MCGCCTQAAAGGDTLQNRLCKCRAFNRVSAGAKFIKQNERLRRKGLHNADNVDHVCRKGGQGLLNALFVADVGKNAVEHRKCRAFGCRNMQPRLRHERKQTDGF